MTLRGSSRAQPLAAERLGWSSARATCSGCSVWWSREAQSRPLKTRHCGRVPLRHATTSSPEEAAALYAQHALVLNVPLNHDLNHRFFEVMAAGVPQVVFGDPGLVGEHRHLAERSDVFWASSLEQLEELVLQLLAEPERLRAIPVASPPYWELKDLLKAALAP